MSEIKEETGTVV